MHNNNAAKNLDMLKIMDMLAEYMLPNGFRRDFEFFLINHVALDSINRLAAQSAPDREAVIAKMCQYVGKYIPRLSDCECLKAETRNRQIIIRLNLAGLHNISKLILKLKSAL